MIELLNQYYQKVHVHLSKKSFESIIVGYKIEFVIPTYDRPHHLATMLNSLMAQSSPNWIAHVISDCSPPGTIDRLKKWFRNEKRIKWTFLPKRNNDFGHTPRNKGLALATEEFVCMTGEDNYYTPVFVEEVINAFSDQVNFVYTDMIHNWGTEYRYMKCSPTVGEIDCGNAIFRTKFARLMRLDTSRFVADGIFVEEYIRRFGGDQRHINKPIFIHN